MKTMKAPVTFSGTEVITCTSFNHEVYGVLWRDSLGNVYSLSYARRAKKYAFIPVTLK